jgi:ABC-2 type transport system ATP-binding protein
MSEALVIQGLRKSYGETVAVAGIDLAVRRGECFGILGPNGAGKTTTIEICEGLTSPDEGDVVVLGRRWHDSAGDLRQRLGIQLQETQLAEKLTVHETVRLFRSFYDEGRTPDQAIALVNMEEKRNARVGQLSGGQKQRLALACAIVSDPELLFLDEPTTGLDPQSRRQLWHLIEELRSGGRTIVITTHYMDEAQRLCDRVAIVDHGRVIALATPLELIASLGAEHVVEFATSPPAVVSAEELARIPGVRGVRAVGRGWELKVAEPHRAVPRLLELLRAREIALEELRTHSATLEDVFVSLTGRQLRDE